jgi:methionyl-tRNA synthetase
MQKPTITYEDFAKLDIRVGTILSASAPEWSKKLLRFEVDFGEEIGKRILFSGIKEWYSPETLIGKQFPFVVNLAPKKMGDEESQGMMIMADTLEKPVLTPIENVPSGSVIR